MKGEPYRHRSQYAAADTGRSRLEQSTQPSSTEPPCSSAAHAAGGDAHTDRRQLRQAAWRRRTPVHAASGCGGHHGQSGKRTVLRVREHQGLLPAGEGYDRALWVPLALYTDRHSVFKHVSGGGLSSAPTQFSCAMNELGIQMIFASSPQAKGRVERVAGTYQDRLVPELRIVCATTIEDARVVLEDFIHRFNKRFVVPAREPEAAYYPIATGTCLDRVQCFRHTCKEARDNTVRYSQSTLQLLAGTDRPIYAGTKVDVIEGLDSHLTVEHEGRVIPSQDDPARPNVLRAVNGTLFTYDAGP